MNTIEFPITKLAFSHVSLLELPKICPASLEAPDISPIHCGVGGPAGPAGPGGRRAWEAMPLPMATMSLKMPAETWAIFGAIFDSQFPT